MKFCINGIYLCYCVFINKYLPSYIHTYFILHRQVYGSFVTDVDLLSKDLETKSNFCNIKFIVPFLYITKVVLYEASFDKYK